MDRVLVSRVCGAALLAGGTHEQLDRDKSGRALLLEAC